MRISLNVKSLLLVAALVALDQTGVASHTTAYAFPATQISAGVGPNATLAPVLAKVMPAVVNISAQGSVSTPDIELLNDPVVRHLLGLPDKPSGEQKTSRHFQSAGSGVIFDARQGYIVTVSHVVEHADKIQVTLADKRQFDAKLVGSDPQTDIAVLQIEPDRLSSLPTGEQKPLQVGDYVVAVGNPFGLGQTATFGIVSALGRTGLGTGPYEDFIQTDASINPGNSGGALIDTAGRLVGINAALISKDGGNVGVGFAIPVHVANSVAQQLIAGGKVSRGALGLEVKDLSPAEVKQMQTQTGDGALVSQVSPLSAAAKAGIENGDIVVELDGEAITTSGQFRTELGLKRPGAFIRLKLVRGGSPRTVMAMLEPQPQ